MKDLFAKLNTSLSGGTMSSTVQAAMDSLFGSSTSASTAKNSSPSTLQIGGMAGSAALGGLLGALLGGKGAQKLAKGALVVGGTAAAGALAWKFYQKWANNQPQAGAENPSPLTPQTSPESPFSDEPLALSSSEQTGFVLVEAMVFAARADGHIDEQEQANIQNAIETLFPGQTVSTLFQTLLSKPIDPYALAFRVQNPEERRDLYRLSCAIISIDSFMERSYLDGLASALGITAQEKENLEREAKTLA